MMLHYINNIVLLILMGVGINDKFYEFITKVGYMTIGLIKNSICG